MLIRINQLLHSRPFLPLFSAVQSLLVLHSDALNQLLETVAIGIKDEVMQTLIFLNDLHQILLAIRFQFFLFLQLLILLAKLFLE
jgi:hypothetical protein